jgi:uncharacterized damage-inducible protein DinB
MLREDLTMSKLISLEILQELFNYNYWARDRQLQVCATLTEEQFKHPLGSSFTSLRDTLVHMVAVEWLWLERWKGNSPHSLLSPQDFPGLSNVQERWNSVEIQMKEYLSALDDEAIQQPLTCVSTRGETWRYSLWRMMIHFINHQSYHRGQVTTLLRQLGKLPARVDFLEAHESGFQP